MAERQGRGTDFLIGAVVGGVMGAVAALLLAPKSGKELRADIADQAQQLGSKTQKLAETVSSKTQVLAKQVTDQTGELLHKAKEMAESVSEEMKVWKEARKEAAVSSEEPMPADADVLLKSDLK